MHQNSKEFSPTAIFSIVATSGSSSYDGFPFKSKLFFKKRTSGNEDTQSISKAKAKAKKVEEQQIKHFNIMMALCLNLCPPHLQSRAHQLLSIKLHIY